MLRLSQTNIMLVLFYTFTLCSLCKGGDKDIHTQLCSYQYLTNACTSKRLEFTFNLKDPFLESKYIRKLALAVRLLRFLGGTTFIGLSLVSMGTGTLLQRRSLAGVAFSLTLIFDLLLWQLLTPLLVVCASMQHA